MGGKMGMVKKNPCGAPIRNGVKKGQPCGFAAGANTPHKGYGPCSNHGGNLPNMIKKWNRVRYDEMASKALAQLDVDPIENPMLELHKLAGQVVAWKDQMSARVNALKVEEIRYADAKGSEQLRSEIALWERALDRCAMVLAAMAKLNIDERLARIEQSKVELVFEVIEATFVDLGLTDKQKAKLRAGFANNFQKAAIEGKVISVS